MTDRISCCVPGCRRTTKHQCSEWICGPHWMAVAPRLRRRKYRLFRKYRHRFGGNGFWAYPGGSPERILAVKLDRLCGKAWDACKKQAIERAVGI